MTRTALPRLLVAALLALSATTARAEPDPEQLLRQHYDAVNRGDVAAAMAVFAEDAAVIGRGGPCRRLSPCIGKPVIQRQVEAELSRGVRVVVTDVEVSGNSLTARVEQSGTLQRNAGVDRVVRNVTASFSGDKITQFVQEDDLSDDQTALFGNWGRVTGAITQGAAAQQPGWLEAINGGNAPGAVALFAEGAVLEGYGLCAWEKCVGKAAIRTQVDLDVADNVRITVLPPPFRVTGDTVTRQMELRSSSIATAGLERIVATLTASVTGLEISFLRIAPDLSDAQTAAYLAWPPVLPILSVHQEGAMAVFRTWLLNRSPEPADIDLRLFLSGGTVLQSWAGSVDQNPGSLSGLLRSRHNIKVPFMVYWGRGR